MKLIALCGPHAAGKNDVAKEVFSYFGEDFLERIVPCTTRPPRPLEKNGREYFFISREKFESLHQAGEFAFDVTIRGDQRSGTLKSELFSKRRALVDVVPQGARIMRDLLLQENKGQSLLVFIHASKEERGRRIALRDPSISEERVEQMIEHDPVDADILLYHDFDLIVENPDGCLDKTVTQVISTIKEFLNQFSI